VRTKFANLGANNSFLDTSNFEAFLTADQTRARRVWSLVGKN
jgi:hypothetical protein